MVIYMHVRTNMSTYVNLLQDGNLKSNLTDVLIFQLKYDLVAFGDDFTIVFIKIKLTNIDIEKSLHKKTSTPTQRDTPVNMCICMPVHVSDWLVDRFVILRVINLLHVI